MTLKDVLARLESMGDEKVRRHNRKFGAGGNQFGVKHGDIRKLAATIKADPALAHALWQTGNVDAQLLAVLLVKPGTLAADDLDAWVRGVSCPAVADWFNAYVAKVHPDREALRVRWLADSNPWAARAGWSLTSERINREPDGLDLSGILDRLEAEMGGAAPEVQWTMNFCLAGIGIHFAELRPRALALGEKLGLYRDYPVSKGCTSPFAPVWIREMVRRRSEATH